MTTTAVATLSERAVALAFEYEVENEREAAEAKARAIANEIKETREALKKLLGLEEGTDYELKNDYFAHTPDGLVFRFIKHQDYREYSMHSDRERLYVERQCSVCGGSVLVEVWDNDMEHRDALLDLGIELRKESHRHRDGCPENAESIARKDALVVEPPVADRLASVVREIVRDELASQGVGL